MDREANSINIFEAKRSRDLVLSEIEKRESERRDRQLTATFLWLNLKGQDCDQDDHFDAFVDRRKAGTCEWVLGHEKVRSWLDEDDRRPYLWLKGKPGAGEHTMISVFVVTYTLMIRENHYSSTYHTPRSYITISINFVLFLHVQHWPGK